VVNDRDGAPGPQGVRSNEELTQVVRDLARGVSRRDRLLSLNSFVAYLLFTVLLCAALFFLFRGRADEVADDRDRIAAERDALQGKLDAMGRQVAARDASDRAVGAVLELLRRRRWPEAIAAHRALSDVPATQRQFLADAVDGARAELAAEAGGRARQAFTRRDFERAREAAEAALAQSPDGEGAADLRYLLAASLDKLGLASEAHAAYAAFLSSAPEHVMTGRARYRLRRLESAQAAPPLPPE
jgi:tetratricopeptide (TPR) repeat protein